MKIRVGYELIYDFPQSTPVIMVLGILQLIEVSVENP